METLEKKLNVNAVTERMIQKGFSQTEISERIGVSKATVSTWLKPDKFPRPKHLLQLGRLLGLKYDDLVQQELSGQPMVAFRKSGNYKITTEQLEKYNFVSRLLQKLVPHVPFDNLSSPTTLKEPKNDYEYIERAAASVRRSVNYSGGILNFEDLIKLFDEHFCFLFADYQWFNIILNLSQRKCSFFANILQSSNYIVPFGIENGGYISFFSFFIESPSYNFAWRINTRDRVDHGIQLRCLAFV